MPTGPTIENRHQGHAEWVARATAHYATMSTRALAARLRDTTGRLTEWDNSERAVIYEVLEKRHPEIDAATTRAYGATPHIGDVDDTAVILAAIDALSADEIVRAGEPA